MILAGVEQGLRVAASWPCLAWVAYLLRRHRWSRFARQLQARCRLREDLGEAIDAVSGSGWLVLDQGREEFQHLLQRARALRPRYVCEIGTRGGGSLFLLCHVATADAEILSIDVEYTPGQLAGYPCLARPGQRLSCLRADSHDPTTLAWVRRRLRGHPLDLLFIDADHSLAGVSSDYQMYAPLVRPGGLVVFHDIVPVSPRGRQTTQLDSGEVPQFWAALKQVYQEHVAELIESSALGGFGLGVLIWPGECRRVACGVPALRHQTVGD